jgi:hypothetical protein
VLIQQIDLRPEPLKRALGGMPDMLRPAVQTRPAGPVIATARIEGESYYIRNRIMKEFRLFF